MTAADPRPPTACIDLPAPRLRLAGLLLLACGLTAGCLVLLIAAPEGDPIVPPGSFGQVAIMAGVGLFGLSIPLILRELVRRGPVVSISAHGLFDRRLSRDWVPWTAVTALDEVAIGRQHFLRLRVRPEIDAALPWTRRARVSAHLNGIYGGGYWLLGQGVTGGTDAVLDAIARVLGPGSGRGASG